MLDQITPIIATYNEASNIERTLLALSWAKEVLVIDSYSDDQTLEICARFNNVRVIQNSYEGPTEQSNFGLAQEIKTDWVLSMDADYVVAPPLIKEIAELAPNESVKGFEIGFQYLINGQPLKGSLYPPRTSLYRRQSAHYQRDGHTQRVSIDGLVLKLEQCMQHDDRKPYSRWLASQQKYAAQEAQKLAGADWKSLSWPDRLRYWGVAPLVIIPYTLIVKGLVFSGLAGFQYTWQRLIAEIYLQLARLNLRLGK
ncbi:MAG: glycosyltransferase involved in cell wall biosynthesis [Arenicella sp.]|jgi:glycosyltransferase involved in cell wall biosynthesis